MSCKGEIDYQEKYIGVDAGLSTHLGYRLFAEAEGYGKTAQQRHYIVVFCDEVDH